MRYYDYYDEDDDYHYSRYIDDYKYLKEIAMDEQLEEERLKAIREENKNARNV